MRNLKCKRRYEKRRNYYLFTLINLSYVDKLTYEMKGKEILICFLYLVDVIFKLMEVVTEN